MSDSLEVQEILERIRERARLRNQHENGSAQSEQPASSSGQPKNSFTQMLADIRGSLMHWLITSRAIENLSLRFSTANKRLDVLATSQDTLAQRLERLERNVQPLNIEDSYLGPKAAEGLWFNEPIIVEYNASGRPSWGRTSERIIEKAWVLLHLGGLADAATILDVGCAESLLSLELASNGFHVTGVDIRPYPLRHPNFHFVQGDIATAPLQQSSFDAAVLLSTVEHMGLGWYGDATGADRPSAAMGQIYRLLKPGGRLLVTVPFGKSAVTPLHRIFDVRELRSLLANFEIETVQYGIKVDEKTWVMPAAEESAAAQMHDPDTYSPGAIALMVCKKGSLES